jgi:hypothetical protein
MRPLQEILEKRLSKSVHVLNLARDGTGLVQMFDVASANVVRRPDLIIFAFNTSQMVAERRWRVEKMIAGEPRVLTSLINTQDPDIENPALTFDTTIIQPRIDAAWCAKFAKGGELDDVGLEIVDKYLRFRPTRYSLWTLHRSFLWYKLMHGDAFYYGDRPARRQEPRSVPQFDQLNVIGDAHLNADIARLRESAIPFVLVHLPIASEIKAQREFGIASSQELARAIGKMVDQPINGLSSYLPQIDDPEKMSVSPTDSHPSNFGIEAYAKAVSDLLMKLRFSTQRR